MRRQHARHTRGRFCRAQQVGLGHAQGLRDVSRLQLPRAQDARRLRGAIDDGALDAHGAGAAVEHQQVVAEFCMHMRRRGGADAAEAVGRRRRQPALPAFENRQHGLGDGMGGAAQTDGVLSTGAGVGHAGFARQNQGERPGPEGGGKFARGFRHFGRPMPQIGGAVDMHDHGVVGRPPLRGIDSGDGLHVLGVGGQAVNGFSRQTDQFARLQTPHGLDDLARTHLGVGVHLAHLRTAPGRERCRRAARSGALRQGWPPCR